MRLTRRLIDAMRSPARLVGFVRRAAEIVSSGDFGTMLGRVRPRSPSADEYRSWRAAQKLPPSRAQGAPFLVALDPADAASREAMLAALGHAPREASAVLVRRAEGGWTRVGGHDAQPLAHWLNVTGAQWVWWLARPARIEPHAAGAIAEACVSAGTRLVYADHDVEDDAGRPSTPCFKSAWDAEQVIERDYAGPLLVVHASLAADVEAGEGVAGPWRALLHAVLRLDRDAVVHVPRVVLHVAMPFGVPDAAEAVLARRAVAPALREVAQARGDIVDLFPEADPWVRYRPQPACSVSVVIPTRDHVRLLERCLRSVIDNAAGLEVEAIVVDNGSTDPQLEPLLARLRDELPLQVLARPMPFNFARLCNEGVAAAGGRVVVLLNNDTVLAAPAALTELAALASRVRTGAVGPLLAYPDGRLQSAGVLVGVNRTATSALAGFDPRDPGVAAWCATRRRVSAVLGACLAVERSKYRAVGGMDERLAVSHNEVDFCLKLEAAGWANVFTPFARVIHDEGATRGFEVTPEERERLGREEQLFLERWGALVDGIDPAHHPQLARKGNPFAFARAAVDTTPRPGWRLVHG